MEIVSDYVIVGAGSAGCVLANRLSEDAKSQVLLLEAGGDDRPLKEISQFKSNVNVHVPAGFTRMLDDPKVNWRYRTEPDPNTNGRVHAFPRGKVLGGSSSINGMIYIRGLVEDYQGWRQLGLAGWSWEDVEPYFRRAENQAGRDASVGGIGGPLDVGDTAMRHRVSNAMVEAFEQAGVPRQRDLGADTRGGVIFTRLNVKNGRRKSTAVAYLHPAMKRPNLRVEAHALASRIIFEGTRATGVAFERGGETHIAQARREVILSGGAINSPQLLELSGIGDPEILGRNGIAVVAASPQVGENLQDHFSCMSRARMKPGSPSMNGLSRGVRLFGQILKYGFNRTGLLALGGSHITAYVRSGPEQDIPDLQFFASPGTVDVKKLANGGKMQMETQPGMTIGGYVMRPQSRGRIHIRSNDFHQPPAILPNYLDTEADRRGSIAAFRWARRVIHQPALAPYFDSEMAPGVRRESDEDLLAYARATGSTSYHQSGTCAMGRVLDEKLQVTGVQNLRVIDASSMPTITSGNTHAGTVMIAEKASDIIRAA